MRVGYALCALSLGLLAREDSWAQPPVGEVLSLRQAVEAALSDRGAVPLRQARAALEEAAASSDERRSRLLPHLQLEVGQSRQTRNLEALGLRPAAAFRPPTLVGPFSTFDARATFRQTLFDRSALHELRASRQGERSLQAEADHVRQQIIAAVARLYLAAQRTSATLEAVQADLSLARRILRLTRNQKAAGTGLAIEVTRAEVQVSQLEQRLLAAQLAHRRAWLSLLKEIGWDLDRPVTQLDPLAPPEPTTLDVAGAVALAFANRADYRAQLARVRRAELERQASSLLRWPSLAAFADYGTIGSYPHDSLATWSFGVSLRLPLLEGGKLEAERRRARARLTQERLTLEELSRRIELEVRLALGSLTLAERQVGLASQQLRLSELELAQAQRRYEAGIVTSLELSRAQTAVEAAREQEVAALYGYHLARLELAEATGGLDDYP